MNVMLFSKSFCMFYIHHNNFFQKKRPIPWWNHQAAGSSLSELYEPIQPHKPVSQLEHDLLVPATKAPMGFSVLGETSPNHFSSWMSFSLSLSELWWLQLRPILCGFSLIISRTLICCKTTTRTISRISWVLSVCQRGAELSTAITETGLKPSLQQPCEWVLLTPFCKPGNWSSELLNDSFKDHTAKKC